MAAPPRRLDHLWRMYLQCLCHFHHQLKTMGLWDAVMLAGGAILWTNSYGEQTITLPGGGLIAVPADPTLLPKIGHGPEHWQPPDPDDPDEPPPF